MRDSRSRSPFSFKNLLLGWLSITAASATSSRFGLQNAVGHQSNPSLMNLDPFFGVCFENRSISTADPFVNCVILNQTQPIGSAKIGNSSALGYYRPSGAGLSSTEAVIGAVRRVPNTAATNTLWAATIDNTGAYLTALVDIDPGSQFHDFFKITGPLSPDTYLAHWTTAAGATSTTNSIILSIMNTTTHQVIRRIPIISTGYHSYLDTAIEPGVSTLTCWVKQSQSGFFTGATYCQRFDLNGQNQTGVFQVDNDVTGYGYRKESRVTYFRDLQTGSPGRYIHTNSDYDGVDPATGKIYYRTLDTTSINHTPSIEPYDTGAYAFYRDQGVPAGNVVLFCAYNAFNSASTQTYLYDGLFAHVVENNTVKNRHEISLVTSNTLLTPDAIVMPNKDKRYVWASDDGLGGSDLLFYINQTAPITAPVPSPMPAPQPAPLPAPLPQPISTISPTLSAPLPQPLPSPSPLLASSSSFFSTTQPSSTPPSSSYTPIQINQDITLVFDETGTAHIDQNSLMLIDSPFDLSQEITFTVEFTGSVVINGVLYTSDSPQTVSIFTYASQFSVDYSLSLDTACSNNDLSIQASQTQNNQAIIADYNVIFDVTSNPCNSDSNDQLTLAALLGISLGTLTFIFAAIVIYCVGKKVHEKHEKERKLAEYHRDHPVQITPVTEINKTHNTPYDLGLTDEPDQAEESPGVQMKYLTV